MRQVFHGTMPHAGKLQCLPFAEALEKLRGKHVLLSVGEAKPTRSNSQNKYYWSCVVGGIAHGMKDAGFEPLECTSQAVHDMLKFRFLRMDRPIGQDGEFVSIIRSTTDLDTQEFSEYLEHCLRFAAEYLGIVIPAAGEQTELHTAA